MKTIDKQSFFDKIGYKPHSPKQAAYHLSPARFRIPTCGRRFGKSLMVAKDLEPSLFIREPKRYWIVGATYDLAEKEFRPIWDDLFIKLNLGKDKRIKRAYNKRSGEMFIEFPWGTRVECRSAQHPEQLVGESLDGVIMSEAAKHNAETWERFIRPALSDKRGWATFPSTPEGHNWYYELWRMGNNPNLKDYESWRNPSWDNKVVYPGGYDDPEIQLLLETMTEERFMQEIGADFASFTGKIYSEFDEGTHLRNIAFNPMWPNYISFDFGFTNPLAAVEFQIDPQDNIYIWREHYKGGQTIAAHLNELKARVQPAGYRLDFTFGDAADPEAILQINQDFAGCVGLPEAKTNWRQGIDLVKKFLKVRPTGLYDAFDRPLEQPKLFVDYSCTNTIREFVNYRAKEGTNGMNAQEIARKMDDHAMDALRYGLVHIFELGIRHSHLSDVVDVPSERSANPEESYSVFTEDAMTDF